MCSGLSSETVMFSQFKTQNSLLVVTCWARILVSSEMVYMHAGLHCADRVNRTLSVLVFQHNVFVSYSG